MAKVRSQDTTPELRLRSALWKSGMRYRLRPDLPGTPDIALPFLNIALFVDGCFWHGCPEHYTKPVRNANFWRQKLNRNVRRDMLANQSLAELGWTVIRIWEHEVAQHLDAVVGRIKRLAKDRARYVRSRSAELGVMQKNDSKMKKPRSGHMRQSSSTI